MHAKQLNLYEVLGEPDPATSGPDTSATVGNPPYQETAERKKSRYEVLHDYEVFTAKFKAAKTTDDCYTPAPIYAAVVDYVDKKLMPLEGMRVRRPFKPGGDFRKEAETYGDCDVVIDNPPFSILTKIVDFYTAEGIKFFLFAPGLTLFSAPRQNVTYLVAHADLTYENKAVVRTSFITNMEGRHRIVVDGEFGRKLTQISREHHKSLKPKTELTKWHYPIHLVTSALLGRIAERGLIFKVPFDEAYFVRKMDNAPDGKAIFGGGYLLSERAAAERAAAERAAAERAAAERAAAERAAAEMRLKHTVELSPRELEIIKDLSK